MQPVRDRELDRRAHVEPALSEADIDLGWARLRHPPAPARRGRRWATAGVTLAAAAAVLLFVLQRSDASPRWAGTTLEAANEAVTAELDDGSEVLAEADSTLRKVAERSDETRIALERGAATFEVTRNPSRTFIVEADGVEVRVVGTRFRVSRTNEVEVSVERGAVDVVHEGEVTRLRAGDSWSPPEEVAVVELPPIEVEQSERPRRVRPSADTLFDRARSTRRDGSAREAVRAYEAFLRAYPRDSRASLASFELGRLKMDSLGDARGAIRAFERSLRDSSSPFRQDAMARIVEAHASVGAQSACRRARDAYLRRYPAGRHRADVESACE